MKAFLQYAAMLVTVVFVASCQEPSVATEGGSSSKGCDQSPVTQGGYSDALLARRHAAFDRLCEFDPPHRFGSIREPVTVLAINSRDISQDDIKFILAPFKDELERLRLSSMKLQPEFLEYLATMPNLKWLCVEGRTGLHVPDFRHLAGTSAQLDDTTVFDAGGQSIRPWLVPDETLRFSDWETSDDGKVSMRIMVETASVAADQPIWVYVELRNNTSGPMLVESLFPFELRKRTYSYRESPTIVVTRTQATARPREEAGMKYPDDRVVHPDRLYRARTRIYPEAWADAEASQTYDVSRHYVSAIDATDERIRETMKCNALTGELIEVWEGDIQSPPITIERVAVADDSTP